ncbi:MAG: AAA family ATPase [Chloroflexota bacterium]
MPDLNPNFSLSDLNRHHLQQQPLRRLLFQVFVILPLLTGCEIAFFLFLFQAEIGQVIIGGLVGVVLGMGVGITGSMIFALAPSIVVGVTVAFVSGIWLGLDPEQTRATQIENNALWVTALFGLAFGLGGGIIGGIGNSILQKAQKFPVNRQIGGTFLGILIGAGILYVGAWNLTGEHWTGTSLTISIALLVGLLVSWVRNRTVGIFVSGLTLLALQFGPTMLSSEAQNPILFISLIIIPYLITERYAGSWPAAIASALGGGLGWIGAMLASYELSPLIHLSLAATTIVVGLLLFWLRPIVLYPFLVLWHLYIRWVDGRMLSGSQAKLRQHAAFWDEYQYIPWFGLDEHILLILDRSPDEGHRALEYVTNHKNQRWAARSVQIEIDAQRLEESLTVQAIGNVYFRVAAGELEGPASALLRSFSRISKDVEAASQQVSAYNQRLAFSAIEDRLDQLIRELTRSSETYAIRFRPIAIGWRQIIGDHGKQLVALEEERQEIVNPYVIGAPLTERQAIFIGRTNISTHIERLILNADSPPLLLYGQRRMGKTSLLNNLSRLLPSTIVPLFVDLQGPISLAKDYTGFLYNLSRAMITSASKHRGITFPPLTRAEIDVDPFTAFDEWLDRIETLLGDETALLTLDEFETLDYAINKGRFDEETVLGTLRHLIQHRQAFKVMIAGSHSLNEFQRWANYLVNAHVIEIGPLLKEEAVQLIERPVMDFRLKFTREAIERILYLTQYHPYLTQLLCSEVVIYKNDQTPATRLLATADDVNQSMASALQRGSLFFADIAQNQVDAAGLNVLQALASGEGHAAQSRETLSENLDIPDQIDATLAHLEQRDLIIRDEGLYRFRIPLIRYWFQANYFDE